MLRSGGACDWRTTELNLRESTLTVSRKSLTSTKGGRLNKSAWIRLQPKSLSAQAVVDNAKAEGITLSLAQVYTARSTAKHRPITSAFANDSTPAQVEASSRTVGRKAASGDDLRRQFIVLARRIGTDEAQRLLKRILNGSTAGRVAV